MVTGCPSRSSRNSVENDFGCEASGANGGSFASGRCRNAAARHALTFASAAGCRLRAAPKYVLSALALSSAAASSSRVFAASVTPSASAAAAASRTAAAATSGFGPDAAHSAASADTVIAERSAEPLPSPAVSSSPDSWALLTSACVSQSTHRRMSRDCTRSDSAA